MSCYGKFTINTESKLLWLLNSRFHHQIFVIIKHPKEKNLCIFNITTHTLYLTRWDFMTRASSLTFSKFIVYNLNSMAGQCYHSSQVPSGALDYSV